MSYDLPCIVMLLGHDPARGAVADRHGAGYSRLYETGVKTTKFTSAGYHVS